MTTDTAAVQAPPGRFKIVVMLNELLFRKQMSINDLAEKINIDRSNLSKLKNGHVSMIRITTLRDICVELDCTPGDLFKIVPDTDTEETTTD